MFRLFIICAAVGMTAALLVGPVIAQGQPDAVVRERQAQAAAMARAGNTGEALAIIESLRETAPGDLPLIHDETVILSWDGRHEQVAINALLLDPASTPAYVAGAVGKSARESGRFADAVRWYRAGVAGEPDNTDLQLGLAMALTDTGDGVGGRQVLDELPAVRRRQADALMVSAYIHQAEGAFILAVTDYDAVLALEPGRPDALRNKALALQQSLLPQQALAIEAQYPGTLTAAEISRLEADRYALALRDAAESPDEKYSFVATNQALNQIDDRLAIEDPDSDLARSLRHDRIVGLVAAARWEKAIDYYETLIDSGDPGRAYVHLAAGTAYMNTFQPEQAEAALRRGEAQAPDDRLIKLQLFYALSDLERADEALVIADELRASLKTVQRVTPDARVSKPNEARMQAEIMSGIGRAYADEMRPAEEWLERLTEAAPNNLDARAQLGNVYRWRGRPDKAGPEYEQVLTINPDMVAARVGRAHNNLDLREYRAVEAEMQEMGRLYVPDPGVWDFNQRWIVHNSSNLIIDARWGESSGTTFGSDQFTIDGWWFSRPINYNYRVYGRTFDSYAEFEDGDHTRRRAAVGGDWRDGPWRVQAEMSFDRDGFGDSGVSALAEYWLTGEWTLGGQVEFNSYATPLRADRAGIESNRYDLYTRFRRDERYSADAGVYYQDFDDGNSVFGASAGSRLRLYERFRYWLDGYVSTAASTASKEDAVYFNPEFVINGLVGVDNTWRMYRRYDTWVTHRLGGNVGLVNQKNFGTDPIWTLDYELNYAVNDQLRFYFGVELNGRVYDGESEDGTFFRAGVNGWF